MYLGVLSQTCPCFAGSFEPCLLHSASLPPLCCISGPHFGKRWRGGCHLVNWCDCQERTFLSSTLHCNETINVIHLRYDCMIFCTLVFRVSLFSPSPSVVFSPSCVFTILSPACPFPACVSVYNLCSPSFLCQFALCSSVFSCDATMCSTPASSPVSPSVFLWYVSFLLFLECSFDLYFDTVQHFVATLPFIPETRFCFFLDLYHSAHKARL